MQLNEPSGLSRKLTHLAMAALVCVFVLGCKGYGKPPTKDEASTKTASPTTPEKGTAEDDDE